MILLLLPLRYPGIIVCHPTVHIRNDCGERHEYVILLPRSPCLDRGHLYYSTTMPKRLTLDFSWVRLFVAQPSWILPTRHYAIFSSNVIAMTARIKYYIEYVNVKSNIFHNVIRYFSITTSCHSCRKYPRYLYLYVPAEISRLGLVPGSEKSLLRTPVQSALTCDGWFNILFFPLNWKNK